MVLSIFFAGIGIYHLILNWRVFVNYIMSRVSKGLHYKRELIISIVIVLSCTFGSYSKIFPFGQFIAFNEWVKKTWVTSPDFEPPIAHAEALSLVSFTTRMGMDLEQALDELKKNKISVEDVNDSLSIIGERNHVSPMEIYLKIKKFEKPITPSTVFTEEMVEQKFEGRGIGEKTLSQVAKENNLDLDAMQKRLLAQGLTLKEGETIRQLADRQKTKTIPIQILKMALVDKSVVSKEATKSPLPITPPPAKPAPTVSPKSDIPTPPATIKTPGYTEEMVRAQFEGKGVGEKPLAQVVKENNLDRDYINKRLVGKNLSMMEGETLKQMASRYNTTPIELMKMILVENPTGK